MDADLGVAQGTIKWWNQQSGYGFVTLNDGREAFIHYSKISKACARTGMNDGEPVTLRLWNGDRGLYGTEVFPISS